MPRTDGTPEPGARRPRSAGSSGAPASILRKLDPNLPGIDESLVELEVFSAPRSQIGFPPQRLMMTLLADFWTGRTEALPSAALVELLGAFDISEPSARMTIGRLAARGALTLERRGRSTWYRQSQHLLALLGQGRSVLVHHGPPRTGWDGTWTVLAWNVTNKDAAAAHRLRLDLREVGFASLMPGVWVCPDPPDPALHTVLERSEGVRFSLFSGAGVDGLAGVPAASAWDLDEIRPMYDGFLATFGPLLDLARAGSLDDRQSFATRTRAVYRWFVMATSDPDLPAELLPTDWPRTPAHDVFDDLVDITAPAALRHVRQVVAACDPEAASLVTAPLPYHMA